MALLLRLHFGICSDVYCAISSFHLPELFQLSPSRDRRYRIHLLLISSHFPDVPAGLITPIANRAILISVVMVRSPKQGRSNHGLVGLYHELNIFVGTSLCSQISQVRPLHFDHAVATLDDWTV